MLQCHEIALERALLSSTGSARQAAADWLHSLPNLRYAEAKCLHELSAVRSWRLPKHSRCLSAIKPLTLDHEFRWPLKPVGAKIVDSFRFLTILEPKSLTVLGF